MVKMTVSLPLFKNGNIAWLAMESLKRQVFPNDFPVQWELIVYEDNIKPVFGRANIMGYREALEKIGCARIEYVLHDRHLGLNQKWVNIANTASPESQFMILQDADCYSHPWRLQFTYNQMLEKKLDWVDSNRAVFYDIPSGCFAEYKKPTKTTGLNIGVNIKLVKTIYAPEKARMTTGLNKWLLIMNMEKKGKAFFRKDHFRDEGWKNGLDTNGEGKAMNQIKRGDDIQNFVPPFYPYKGDTSYCIDGNTFNRLLEMKK